MAKQVTPAMRAAGALIVTFVKKGTIQGSFSVPEMVEIINRETGLPELITACEAALLSVKLDLALVDGSRIPQSEAKRFQELQELLRTALAKARKEGV